MDTKLSGSHMKPFFLNDDFVYLWKHLKKINIIVYLFLSILIQ